MGIGRDEASVHVGGNEGCKTSVQVEREVRNIQRDAGDIQGDEERDEVMAESEKIAEVAVRNVVRIVRRSRSTKGGNFVSSIRTVEPQGVERRRQRRVIGLMIFGSIKDPPGRSTGYQDTLLQLYGTDK